jgi:hypothetical protein
MTAPVVPTKDAWAVTSSGLGLHVLRGFPGLWRTEIDVGRSLFDERMPSIEH